MGKKLEKIIKIFKALSCETRLKIIIKLINESECGVNVIAQELNISQPNVSQHLMILKNADIIEGFRKGNQICYKLTDINTKKIFKLFDWE